MADDPFRFADRLTQLKPSGIRKFFELGLSMKDPIDLSIGQADFDVPAEIKAAAIEAIESGHNLYTVTQGIPELRNALRERLGRRFGDTEGEEILVTGGVSGGLLLSFMALLNPGDEVLVPDPYFVMYRHLAVMVGATSRTYDTYPDFRVNAERIRERITDKTRIIVINSPSNPTGNALTEQEARDIASLAEDTGIPLISDEIYEEFIYDDRHVSPREFTRNCIVLSGASKSMGVPGWRIGWMLAPQALSERMYMLQQFSYVCAPAPFQHAVCKGLSVDFEAHRNDYRVKRDLIFEGLRERFGCVRPGGAFYIFPQLPEGVKLEAFMERCIERELLVVPGSACSERATNFRLCYATSNEKLERAIEMLNEIADELR